VSFSVPAESQNEALLSPPKAKVIRER